MFKRDRLPLWLGILLLSGTFLLGQQSWGPENECIDTDEDGYGNPANLSCEYSQLDCDDGNAAVNPGATEGPYGDPTCDDGFDNDCDGDMDGGDSGCCECIDLDTDGYGDPGCENCTHPETDCNDSNADMNPGASEGPGGDPTCEDTLDNDCDGNADTADPGCVNGIILDQELDAGDQGYTVLRVWGSHYEMGYAHATLLGDSIVAAVDQFEQLVGSYTYSTLRDLMEVAAWQPPGIEDEFQGMADSLSLTHPSAGIDDLDLKVANSFGDWGFQCRSHVCWGRYVAEPIKTLATRRLDQTTPVQQGNHHVLCAWDPDDGSPEWVNLAWPGYVTVATAVNEFGTLASLNTEFPVITDLSAGRLSRMVAARHVLTFPTDPDISMHLSEVFAELQGYESMTNGFLTYYIPEGHGGVMTADPTETGPDYYHLRLPQTVWHHGEAMITTNVWTDGTDTPWDEDFSADLYYGVELPKTLASHWDLLAVQQNDPLLSMHMLSVEYRGRGDMTLWADGRLEGVGRTPRLEWEWGDLFGD